MFCWMFLLFVMGQAPKLCVFPFGFACMYGKRVVYANCVRTEQNMGLDIWGRVNTDRILIFSDLFFKYCGLFNSCNLPLRIMWISGIQVNSGLHPVGDGEECDFCQYSLRLFQKVPWLILLSCLSLCCLSLEVYKRVWQTFLWQLGTMAWHVPEPEYASFFQSQCNSNLCALGIHHLSNKSHLTDDSSCLWLHSSRGPVRGQNPPTPSFELKERFEFNRSQIPSFVIKGICDVIQLAIENNVYLSFSL